MVSDLLSRVAGRRLLRRSREEDSAVVALVGGVMNAWLFLTRLV